MKTIINKCLTTGIKPVDNFLKYIKKTKLFRIRYLDNGACILSNINNICLLLFGEQHVKLWYVALSRVDITALTMLPPTIQPFSSTRPV